MRRESILGIWIGGFVLAVLLYVIGPDRFIDFWLGLFDLIDEGFRSLVAALGAQVYGVARALAIAMYVVFAVLAFASAQRHQRGIGALIGMTILLAVLVWRPWSYYPAPLSRWLVALALSVTGAVIMTQRLMGPPRNGPVPPYPPGGRL